MNVLLFTDSMIWNATEKTAVSVRDGVIEYYGFEIGEQPADKVFTVYRSPATIAQTATAMVGIPLIDNHIDPDVEPDETAIGGRVASSEVIDHFDDVNNSKLAVRNSVTIKDNFITILESGKRELSLGYKARLVPHDTYDFEQRDIQPKHLAIVDAGRCGNSCSFIDRKGVLPMPKLIKAFLDAEGQPNLEQIVEIAQALPAALKELPVDELQKALPALQQIVESAGVAPVTPAPMEDEEPEGGEEVVKVEDEDPEEKAAEDDKKFEDALSKVLAHHTEVIEKARNFVDEDYKFTGKSASTIMRDALAVQYGSEKFTDAELPIAFKLLKQRETDLSNFGDAAANMPQTLTDRIAKDLEG